MATEKHGIPWVKMLMIVALVYGAWSGFQVVKKREGGFASIGASFSGDISVDELKALAATVKEGDVLMYTTTSCPYCAQARSWLRQYGFAFTECDMQVRPRCEDELKALGGVGVPYLVVKGHHMKDGFDSDEFIAALR